MASAIRLEEPSVSPEEYLAFEADRPERHEYVAGAVYAISGASVGHGRIILNIVGEFSQQLRGHHCEAFTSELKVRIRDGTDEFYYYPDILVDCGQPADTSLFAEEPRVIFEVLSPGTARADRHEKRQHYQKIASLDAYVLVSQARVAVTVYRRAGADWTVETLDELPAVLALPTISCALPLATIYERTLLAR